MAVDSRATGGMYIGSGSVRKIIEINKVSVMLESLTGKTIEYRKG